MSADLESFLEEANKFVTAKELTLFALGGRGYYENPASDLLAFFLKPDAEHGLGDLFLSTFLEQLGNHPPLDMSHVNVEREVRTAELSRIDLQIFGPNWCLLIENKIYHWKSNPFDSYEAHARKHNRPTNLYSILSPDGQSVPNWVGVSYIKYCEGLQRRMKIIAGDSPQSKWHLFAHEFILHMTNELNNPRLTTEQIAFVEKHVSQIADVRKLADQYRSYVSEKLKQQLDATFCGRNLFATKDEGWGFRCSTPRWGDSEIVLIMPKSTGGKLCIRVYLDRTARQGSDAMLLQDMEHHSGTEGWEAWESRKSYDSREQAIAELCKKAQLMDALIKK